MVRSLTSWNLLYTKDTFPPKPEPCWPGPREEGPAARNAALFLLTEPNPLDSAIYLTK